MVGPLAVNEFPDFCDELAGPFESRFFASYVSEVFLCVCASNLGIKPKVTYDQPMRRMLECRVRFGYCCRSFLSPALYMSALTKKS